MERDEAEKRIDELSARVAALEQVAALALSFSIADVPHEMRQELLERMRRDFVVDVRGGGDDRETRERLRLFTEESLNSMIDTVERFVRVRGPQS